MTYLREESREYSLSVISFIHVVSTEVGKRLMIYADYIYSEKAASSDQGKLYNSTGLGFHYGYSKSDK